MPYNKTADNFQNTSQLLGTGFLQHMAIGKRLKSRLVDQYKLLSPYYDSTEIYLQATDKPRTQDSGLGQMAGLYPDNTKAINGWIPAGKNATGFNLTWVDAK